MGIWSTLAIPQMYRLPLGNAIYKLKSSWTALTKRLPLSRKLMTILHCLRMREKSHCVKLKAWRDRQVRLRSFVLTSLSKIVILMKMHYSLHCQLRKINTGKCKHRGNSTSLSPKGFQESPIADHYREYCVFMSWSLQGVALLYFHYKKTKQNKPAKKPPKTIILKIVPWVQVIHAEFLHLISFFGDRQVLFRILKITVERSLIASPNCSE